MYKCSATGMRDTMRDTNNKSERSDVKAEKTQIYNCCYVILWRKRVIYISTY